MPDQCSFPYALHESDEPLWGWDVSSDALCLSRGACRMLGLEESGVPRTMEAYRGHMSTAGRESLAPLLNDMLRNGRTRFLNLLYYFDSRRVVERMVVLRRDAADKAEHILGLLEVGQEGKDGTVDSRVGHWVCSFNDGLIRLDRTCAAFLGYSDFSPGARRLKHIAVHLFPEDRKRIARTLGLGRNSGCRNSINEVISCRTINGGCTRMEISAAVLERDEEGRVVLLAGTLQHAVQIGLSRLEPLVSLAALTSGISLWDWDTVTDEVRVSPQYLSMLGYAPENFPRRLANWAEKIHPDDFARTFPLLHLIVKSPTHGDSFEVTYRMRKADGDWAWILGRGHVTYRDDNGRALRLVGVHTDITLTQRGREKLEDMVKTDALTGLRSRAFFEMATEELAGSSLSWPVSVISCDLNGLKLINDHLGHAAGDEALIQAAMLLRRCMRSSDCLARTGGDEFVALLSRCSARQVRRIAMAIERRFQEYNSDKNHLPVLLAVGTATSTSNCHDLAALIKDADRAMLEAKAMSRPESHWRIKRWIEEHHAIPVSLKDIRYAGAAPESCPAASSQTVETGKD